MGHFILNNGNWYYDDKIYHYCRIRDRIFVNKMLSVFYYVDLTQKEIHRYTNDSYKINIIVPKADIFKFEKIIYMIIKRMSEKIYGNIYNDEINLLKDILKYQ